MACLTQLRADLRSDDLDVAHHEIRGEEILLQRADYLRRSHAVQVIHRVQDAAALLVAEVIDLLGDRRVPLRPRPCPGAAGPSAADTAAGWTAPVLFRSCLPAWALAGSSARMIVFLP